MQYRKTFTLALCALAGCSAHKDIKNAAQAPVTEEVIFGVAVKDPHRALENIDDPAVKAWVEEKDRESAEYLNAIPERIAFHRSLIAYLYLDATGVPLVRNQKLFYHKRTKDRDKSAFYMLEAGKEERLLIDPLKLDAKGTTSLGMVSPSPDGKWLAYTLKKNNADNAVLYVMNTETGKNTDKDVIPGARYAYPSWTKDSKAFYYTEFPVDESIPVESRPGKTRILRHTVGTDAKNDVLLRKALEDPTKFHNVRISDDGKWLVYTIDIGWNGNELYVKHIDAEEWTRFPAAKDTHYTAEVFDDTLFVTTNENAPNFKIVSYRLPDKGSPDFSAPSVVIPERKDAVIDSVDIVGGKLAVVTIENVVNRLRFHNPDGSLYDEPDIQTLSSISGVSGESTGDIAYFSVQSFDKPSKVWAYDINNKSLTLFAETHFSGKTDDVVSEQQFATSKDGTKIPYFVVRRKDTALDGTAPTILYGYGGFNVSITPAFRPDIYAWLDRGGIYVYSNLRGGSEFGEAWHEAGKGKNKQNVFDDFAAVADSLVEKHYTSPKKLAAYGGSNGGLLTGVALTQFPEKFGAVVIAVPLLDMIRYTLFGSGKTWISEYGDPAKEEDFKILYAYSPYHHVTKRPYPATLFMGADSDDRVDPMHARKMAAAVKEANTAETPVLLRIERNSGHGGADLVKQRITQMTDLFAFLIKNLKE